METFETLEEILARRAIETLEKIRVNYDFWNEKERPYYEALSKAIRVLNAQKDKRHYAKIVRCGECKHRKDSIQCPLYSEGMETADDWFCADGEREAQE